MTKSSKRAKPRGKEAVEKRRRLDVLPALVVFVAIVACIAGLANDYVYDDILLILHDDRIANPASWLSFLTSSYWPPPHPHDLYRPIASLFLAVQFMLGGGAPIVFRVVSYLLYAASSVAVFRLAARILPRNDAAAVALLFAAHPVHVEAVALGVNQGELIVAILSCWAACIYIDRRRAGAGRLAARDWFLLGAIYAIATLTKENGFVLPGLLAAVELCAIDAPSIAERVASVSLGFVGLGALGVALAVVRAIVLGGNMVGAFTADALVGLGLGGRALTMLRVVPIWLRLLAWPAHLQADYAPNEVVASTSFGGIEAAGLTILLCAIGIAILCRRKAPAVTFGLLWCAIALFPVSNIVPISITVAERTLFLPSVGFVIACVALVGMALRVEHGGTATQRTVAASACAALVVLGVARSAQRETTWRNAPRFWRTAAADAPRSSRVKAARHQAVIDLTKEFEPAIQGSPTPWKVRNELAYLLTALGGDSAAADQLRRSLAESPRQPAAAGALASSLLALGAYRAAEQFIDSESTVSPAANADSTMRRLWNLADSAARVSAPIGSVRVQMAPPNQ